MAWLGTHEATLSEWATVFVQLVDAYLARRGDEGARDLERVRAMLAGIARVDLDGRKVGFREAREHAVRRLVSARADRGEALAAGVMIAPLGAARAVPFRVTFVLGLDEGAFPAGDQPSPLDLRRDVRAGDVSPRERDRHAFLEVLLGTRDQLFLSYVAVEAKSGQPLGPSSVVLELADALAPYLGAASSKLALEQLTVRHPLHRWSGADVSTTAAGVATAAAGGTAAAGVSTAAAVTTTLPPAIARERWAVRVRDAMRAHLRAAGHPVPDEDGMLALLAHPALSSLRTALGLVEAPPAPAPASPSRPLTIGNVRGFLEAPVQAWAQSVLGLDELPDDEVAEHSDEPFHVDKPARALLLREVLAAQLREPTGDPEATYIAVVRDMELRGQFPVGVFGAAARAADLRLLELWRSKLGPIAVGSVTRLAFGRSTSPAAELLSALEITLPGNRSVRLIGQTEILVRDGARYRSIIPLTGKASKDSRYHLRGALDHLVLAAAGLAREGHSHILVDKEGGTREVRHEPWTQHDAQAFLAALVGELLDEPHGYLLPLAHLSNALAGKKPSRQYGDTMPVLGFGPIDRLDGLAAPPDPGAIARRRLEPIVARMKGDCSLGGGGDA
jgi:exodeoxyribonuclease V gamma subunit